MKQTAKKLILILISEVICLTVTRIFLLKYNNPIYINSIKLLQVLYFLPILIAILFVLFYRKSDKSSLIFSTLGLIVYSIILHIWIIPIVSLFTDIQGIINFSEYAFKIYFICLPVVGFSIWKIKKETMKMSLFLVLFKIILLILFTFLFEYWFELKGVLYAMPMNEFLFLIGLYIFKKAET